MKSDNLKRFLRIAIIFVVAAWIIIPTLVILFYGKPDGPGTLGDTFGIVNALFSSLAFALLIYSSMMQREELELQRNELELTRKEIQKSAEAQETLVKLTRDQVELEKLIRRSQIKSELDFKDFRLITNDRSMVQMDFIVKYNSLKFYTINLRGEKKNFEVNKDWDHKMMNKYHQPEAAVFVIIEHPRIEKLNLDGLLVDICFEDLDSAVYKQTLTFDNGNVFLSSPSPYDPTRLLFL